MQLFLQLALDAHLWADTHLWVFVAVLFFLCKRFYFPAESFAFIPEKVLHCSWLSLLSERSDLCSPVIRGICLRTTPNGDLSWVTPFFKGDIRQDYPFQGDMS